jgi:hypothetical protein
MLKLEYDESSFVIYQRICRKSNTLGVTSVGGTGYLSWASEFTSDLMMFVLLDLQFSV